MTRYTIYRTRSWMPDRFECHFMVQYMAGKKFSKEAKAVLAEGKKIWQAYFSTTDNRTTRDELKLNRADVGWYQIRKALEHRNADGDCIPVSFEPFKNTYVELSDKLRLQVYELRFLKQ